jgi:antitoxin component YwqK of YwqJK toxin-antitoxin module
MKNIFLIFIFFLLKSFTFAQTLDTSLIKTDVKPAIDLGKKKKRGLLGRVKGLEKIAALADSTRAMATDIYALSEAEQKEKREPKNTFYGIKTKKFFRKREEGRRVIVEIFYYLPVYEEHGYAEEKYYFDTEKKEFVRGVPKETEKAWLPHGPYERVEDGQTVEKGIYFLGLKHGRWENYSKSGYLTSKEKFYRGFPKDAVFVYFDKDKKRVKEIIPYKESLKDGFYIRFHKSGVIAETGHYKYGMKTGQWVEYYDKKSTANHFRITQHGKDPFDSSFKPFVKKEWNEKGKMVVDVK